MEPDPSEIILQCQQSKEPVEADGFRGPGRGARLAQGTQGTADACPALSLISWWPWFMGSEEPSQSVTLLHELGQTLSLSGRQAGNPLGSSGSNPNTELWASLAGGWEGRNRAWPSPATPQTGLSLGASRSLETLTGPRGCQDALAIGPGLSLSHASAQI